MTIDELAARVEKKLPPAPEGQLRELETALGGPLPADYRRFLKATNGGYLGGSLCFAAPAPEGEGEPIDVALHHVGGFRNEGSFSLRSRRANYRERIPESLLWIMDDPYGNAFCLGLRGEHRGRVAGRGLGGDLSHRVGGGRRRRFAN